MDPITGILGTMAVVLGMGHDVNSMRGKARYLDCRIYRRMCGSRNHEPWKLGLAAASGFQPSGLSLGAMGVIVPQSCGLAEFDTHTPPALIHSFPV